MKIPHSAEAEDGIIGSCLIDSYRCMDVCRKAGITPDKFYDGKRRLVFEVILALHESGVSPDLLTVTDALHTRGALDNLGGAKAIDGFVDRTPTSANIEYYIDIFLKKY